MESPSKDSRRETSLATSPPVGVVVVRETPPRVKNSTTRSATNATIASPAISDTPHSTVHGRTSYSASSAAFRLQPRGKGSILLETPSTHGHPNSRGLLSSGSSGGRKRGAQCLAPSFGSTSGVPRRALFPSKTALAASGSTSSSTASHMSSPAAWSPDDSNVGFFQPPVTSPCRVENALQSLSLKSPIRTPQGQQHCWKGRETSPFHLYGSPLPSGRSRKESIGSVVSASSNKTPNSTSRASPRHVPVQVIRRDGLDRKMEKSIQLSTMPLCPSKVESWENKRNREVTQSQMMSTTPPQYPPPSFSSMDSRTPETHPSTPRMDESTEGITGTPTPRIRSFPSPHDTPLPRVKLTSRRCQGTDASSATTIQHSPQEMDLNFSPASAGFFDPHKKSEQHLSYHLSSNSEPSPPSGDGCSRSRSYVPLPDWCDGISPSSRKNVFLVPPPPAGVKGVASSERRPPVVIRSLLAPCGSDPSQSLQAMATAEAEAAALDCDGSLTDDEEGDELFVLADPSTLAVERHEKRSEGRPSQRRRTSMEGDKIADDANNISSCKSMSASSLAAAQPSSSTSLLGMAFLRGDSMNSFANFRSQHKLSCSGLDKGNGPSDLGDNQRLLSDERAMMHVRSEDSLNSIGLDLDPNSSDHRKGDETSSSIPMLSNRDLHTPPAMQDDPNARSPQLIGRLRHHGNSSSRIAVGGGASHNIYLARSDPGDVHRTIVSLVMAQEKQHSPPMAACRT